VYVCSEEKVLNMIGKELMFETVLKFLVWVNLNVTALNTLIIKFWNEFFDRLILQSHLNYRRSAFQPFMYHCSCNESIF